MSIDGARVERAKTAVRLLIAVSRNSEVSADVLLVF
jgi:hypothetical protein